MLCLFEEVKEPYQLDFIVAILRFINNVFVNVKYAPLCRSSINPLLNEPRILIWSEEQRIPAESYKSSKNLSHEIVLYKAGDETKINDIFYHFFQIIYLFF